MLYAFRGSTALENANSMDFVLLLSCPHFSLCFGFKSELALKPGWQHNRMAKLNNSYETVSNYFYYFGSGFVFTYICVGILNSKLSEFDRAYLPYICCCCYFSCWHVLLKKLRISMGLYVSYGARPSHHLFASCSRLMDL